jgi:hypothetical protein
MKTRQYFGLRTTLLLAQLLWATSPVHAEPVEEVNPFVVTPAVVASNGSPILTVKFHVPEHHHLYADRISLELDGARIATQLPAARQVTDKFSKSERLVYEQDFVATYALAVSRATGLKLTVNYQGCNESECYFPETLNWNIGAAGTVARLEDEAAPAAAQARGGKLAADFHVAARASGYLGSEKFLRFLDESKGLAQAPKDLFSNLAKFGTAATVGLILLGGLALNLTPCVLPMIPINLAILGAGAKNQNRRRSFLLGSTYGSGMALAYGVLGLVVVLTGSKFGTLNSSPWFNFGIAAVFIILGLAMFDKLAVDLSRFQRQSGGGQSSGGGAFVAAGTMGAISALLAGACVAPVVISVLLLATSFYQKGNVFGLLLPFVLGLGMAIPWPFAAAGLSFLPKPGAWMTRVKYAFGVFIFGFAAWYGWIGYSLTDLSRGGAGQVQARNAESDVRALESALKQSRQTGVPVVVDFWASWCKNCEAMEHSTFGDKKVQDRLAKDFITVKFQAERLNEASLKPVLDEFGVMGLPTYIVLMPNAKSVAALETPSKNQKN